MKKILIVLLLSAFLFGCGVEKSPGILEDDGAGGEVDGGEMVTEAVEENILIIAGEGGPSMGMFVKAVETYKKEHGGEVYYVSSGDGFVDAVKDYTADGRVIDRLEYFGHGNSVGLYVNQAPGVNGGLYANDPDQNTGFLAASIFDVERGIFSDNGEIKFNGCNIAEGYPDADTLAQRFANYFEVKVVAPMGPTEFSSSPDVVNPIENSGYLPGDFDGDVYMVPTYSESGSFVDVYPQRRSGVYFDVRMGQSFADAVMELAERGLGIELVRGGFAPYDNVTYGEAREFCRVAYGEGVDCFVSGYGEDAWIRNLDALRMLVDASGEKIRWSPTWYAPYLSWASERDLLTENFVNKKWYTRGEMAELTWNFIQGLWL